MSECHARPTADCGGGRRSVQCLASLPPALTVQLQQLQAKLCSLALDRHDLDVGLQCALASGDAARASRIRKVGLMCLSMAASWCFQCRLSASSRHARPHHPHADCLDRTACSVHAADCMECCVCVEGRVRVPLLFGCPSSKQDAAQVLDMPQYRFMSPGTHLSLARRTPCLWPTLLCQAS